MPKQSIDSRVDKIMEWLVKKGIVLAQERIGKEGEPFIMYKFRTMKYPYKAEGSLDRPPKGHECLIWGGSFLRYLFIDEWPQLYNVYKGEMTLVGPRPLIQSEWKDYLDTVQEKMKKVLPGMTGVVYGTFKKLTHKVREELITNFCDKAEINHTRVQIDFAMRIFYGLMYDSICYSITGKHRLKR